eukprot:5686-Heterococcus_DN1.PRE.3
MAAYAKGQSSGSSSSALKCKLRKDAALANAIIEGKNASQDQPEGSAPCIMRAKVCFSSDCAQRNTAFEDLHTFNPADASIVGYTTMTLWSEVHCFNLSKQLEFNGLRDDTASMLQAPFTCSSSERTLVGQLKVAKPLQGDDILITVADCVVGGGEEHESLHHLLQLSGLDCAVEECDASATIASTGAASSSIASAAQRDQPPNARLPSAVPTVTAECSRKETLVVSPDVAADSEQQDATDNTACLDQALVTVSHESSNGAAGVSLQQRELLNTSTVAAEAVKSAPTTADS